MTTTGITAAMPMSLTLVKAIAGRPRAAVVARDLRLARWDARHDSGAFTLTRPFALTVLRNAVASWRREALGIELSPGIDEVSLALVADAWSRTYRSRATMTTPDWNSAPVDGMVNETDVNREKPDIAALPRTNPRRPT